MKTAFRQPCPFIKTQSSGDFFYDGFEYVCGVAVDLLGGYGWLFSSLDSVVLNDKSQTGEEVEIQPSGASHLQNKQCVCVFLYKLHTEYQNPHSPIKVRTI